MKYSVKIIIPFYKETLKDWEKAALANNMEKLSNYPVVFLKPEGLNISSYEQTYPQAETISVSTDWLGTKRGIAGYNEMMMSEAFYQLFSDCEYILICHTDAWIFRDDLSAWCQKGYDLIAAPWPTRPRYRHFPMKQFIQLKKWLFSSPEKISRMQMYDKIGNGGLWVSRNLVGIIFYLREVLLTSRYEKRLFEHASQPCVAGTDIRLLPHLRSRTNLSRDSYPFG